ncbi:MAG: nucleoside recognition domain-containing protein [Dehalococcoidales bacterium]|jgi:hypothetical protein
MIETLLSALVLAGSLLWRTLPFMILGVIAAELLNALGFVDKLAFLVRPITKFSHLKHESGVSFLIAFGSPLAANSMLAQYQAQGQITKKEMFLASLINTFPMIFMHWRSMLPPLIPLLGIIGIIYFCILMLNGLVKTLLLMFVSRFLLPARPPEQINIETKIRPPFKEVFKVSLKSSWKIIRRIVIVTVPTMIIMCVLIKVGAFDLLASHLGGIGAYLPIPASGLGIIVAMLGNTIAAYTVASNLLIVGEITAKGIIISLMIGSIFSNFIYTLRSSIPYYIGIFGMRNGIQLILISMAIRNGIMIGFVIFLAILWN